MTTGRESGPLPPPHLIRRVGRVPTSAELSGVPRQLANDLAASEWWNPQDPVASYLELGRELALTIRAALPQTWSWEGKRILDFGCGAGRVLRHLRSEAQRAEIYGCDIDEASITWLHRALCPPFRALACDEMPPLPFEDASLDLVYAFSVYTHLPDTWSAWLVEHHRLLRSGGLLLASFLGTAACRWQEGPSVERLEIDGTLVTDRDNDWDAGGPNVFHARWWIEQRWGRGFEILTLMPDGLAMPSGRGQGWALMRRREGSLSTADLERAG